LASGGFLLEVCYRYSTYIPDCSIILTRSDPDRHYRHGIFNDGSLQYFDANFGRYFSEVANTSFAEIVFAPNPAALQPIFIPAFSAASAAVPPNANANIESLA
jgi:hypothetical protein